MKLHFVSTAKAYTAFPPERRKQSLTDLSMRGVTIEKFYAQIYAESLLNLKGIMRGFDNMRFAFLKGFLAKLDEYYSKDIFDVRQARDEGWPSLSAEAEMASRKAEADLIAAALSGGNFAREEFWNTFRFAPIPSTVISARDALYEIASGFGPGIDMGELNYDPSSGGLPPLPIRVKDSLFPSTKIIEMFDLTKRYLLDVLDAVLPLAGNAKHEPGHARRYDPPFPGGMRGGDVKIENAVKNVSVYSHRIVEHVRDVVAALDALGDSAAERRDADMQAAFGEADVYGRPTSVPSSPRPSAEIQQRAAQVLTAVEGATEILEEMIKTQTPTLLLEAVFLGPDRAEK